MSTPKAGQHESSARLGEGAACDFGPDCRVRTVVATSLSAIQSDEMEERPELTRRGRWLLQSAIAEVARQTRAGLSSPWRPALRFASTATGAVLDRGVAETVARY